MPEQQSLLTRYRRGIGTSLRNNSSAYGYSIVATSSFAALSHFDSPPNVVEIFAFVFGAVSAFSMLETVASNLFRDKFGAEPSRVVALGTAFSFASIGAAIGVASLVAWWIDGWLAWLVSGFVATVTYLLVVGVEMVVAEGAEE